MARKTRRRRKATPERNADEKVARYWAIVGLFTLSGACGLIYQVIWGRLAVLVFGGTTYAIATVLGIFFLGLALGSYLAGKYLERSGNLLTWYGWLEIGIGAYAALFPLPLAAIQEVHHALFPALLQQPGLLLLVRVLLAAALLLPVTALMGATVPIIGALMTRSTRHLGTDFGLVYACNTLGAAAGGFLSAFFLIPAIGLTGSSWVAAGTNLAVGALSLYWARGSRPAAPRPADSGVAVPGTAVTVTRPQAVAALAGFALTGFLGLVYEVAWTRALVLVFGTSVYAFATMLTTYLVGLALGSLIMGRFVDRIRSLLATFALIQVVVGAAVLVSTYAIGQLPHLLVAHFRADTPWRQVVMLEFALCFAIMFIPAFGSGTLFPLVAKIFVGQRQFRVGRTIADAYAVNTVGSILGSFAAGFALIPLLGIEQTLLLGASLNLLLAAGLLAFLESWGRRRRLAVGLSLVAAAVVSCGSVQTWQPLVMNSGVYMYGEPLARLERQVDTFAEETRLLHYREGPSATVAVLESPNGRFLRINGKTDGGYVDAQTTDNFTQSLLGLLPLLYVPQVDQALVIGAGTGMTLDAVHSAPGSTVDCIEISPAVAEAARYFDHVNGAVLDSPRVRMHLLDGRTWLAALPRSYDVIVSEPSHPWQTGNANLFTADFFRLSAQRLSPQGVICQWLPYYQMDKEHFQTLIRTFQQTYPYVNLWVVYSDAILIGSLQPLEIDWEVVKQRLDEPRFFEILDTLGIRSANDLLSFFYLDPPATKTFAGERGELNTDDHPVIEYAAPKYLLQTQRSTALYDMLQLSLASPIPVVNMPALAHLEQARVAERAKYLRRWGIPERVVQQMLEAYATR